MANLYSRVSNFGSETHFSEAVTGELAYSRMVSSPTHLTTFNAGDIVPIYCLEILPHDTIEMSLDFVIRQNTVLAPTMGSMEVDYYAFFVPNRVVNRSWKNVMGENSSGSWTAPDVQLAPLKILSGGGQAAATTVPVGSVADYYGFPTQYAIPGAVLAQCHDLKFRGYVEIYNEFFRDQNYQPPIPYSKLNVYQGFFDTSSAAITPTGVRNGSPGSTTILSSQAADGSFGAGAIIDAVYGDGTPVGSRPGSVSISDVTINSRFHALNPPLKANKLHDYFTSVLPSPMKGPEVLLPLTGNAPVLTGPTNFVTSVPSNGLRWVSSTSSNSATRPILASMTSGSNIASNTLISGNADSTGGVATVVPANLYADLSQVTSATLSDLRMAAAVQQLYEALARGGSRYRETVRVLFGLEVDNPYEDIPTLLGHFRRTLDLYQTAQTAASAAGSTPQGNLAAFGYTANSGYLFKRTFLEHGYVHIFAVVRHRNVYSSFLARDNFRLSMLDFYQPPLANISEQPVYLREINPFVSNANTQAIGYQEAWAEYRYDPDYVSGAMRPAPTTNLSLWNYADDVNSAFQIVTGDWLRSNSQEVLDRTLAVKSINPDNPQNVEPQLRGQFRFRIDKERPMPTYSVPGLDIF